MQLGGTPGSSFLTTSTVAPETQFAFWREAVCETFLRLQVDRDQRRNFRGEIKSSDLDLLKLHRVDAQSQFVSLRHSDLRHRERDCLYVNFQMAGQGQISQNGRDSVAQIGQWYVLDGTAPFELRYNEDFVSLNLEVSREVFRSQVGDESKLGGAVFGVSGGVERVLRDVAYSLSVEAADISEQQKTGVSSLFFHVLNLAVNSSRGGYSLANASPRRVKIDRFIRANLIDPLLDAGAIAQGCNMSLRTLHATFAESGETVMQYVRASRMRLAAHLLKTESRHRSITDIAFASGFLDSTSFSRAFRTHFGITPREFRIQASI